MKNVKIKEIKKTKSRCYDITVNNNHNFFANGFLIHNCGYTGEIKVLFHNSNSDVDVIIEKGDKIAQLIPTKVIGFELQEVDELFNTKRGKNGFGSTGK